jgi:hypothetical protein
MKDLVRFGFICLLAVVVLGGCSAYRAYYDIGLTRVERPAAAMEQFGNQDVTKMVEQGPDKSFFEDGLTKIVWTPTSREISFDLTNKTDQPIEIIWDESRFVDQEGKKHPLIHSGTDYAKMDDPQPPLEVAAQGSISTAVFPTNHIYYSDARYQKKPLFPNFAMSRKKDKLEEEGKTHIGKKFKILLPLRIKEAIHEYVFTFEVSGVDVKD